MRATGKRSSTEGCGFLIGRGRRQLLPALVLLAAGALPASGLDLFALWRQPEVPLHLEVGAWSQYQRQSLTSGRREEDLLQIQCLAPGPDHPDATWLLEILPLVSSDTGLAPIAGEGLRLWFSDALQTRQGDLLDAVLAVQRWQDGTATTLPHEQWHDDPLISDTLVGQLPLTDATDQGSTVRVIGGLDLTCQQLAFTAVDTLSKKLPAGTLVQVTTQEVTAAVNPAIPLLGVAYAAERLRAESTLTPPSRRFPAPPPQIRVETLECVGFGNDARPWLATVPARSR